jgi:adenosylhomocysteine nucleosidase
MCIRDSYRLYTGALGSAEVYLACSGIGKANSAACTQKLIDCYGVDCIINMGVAGGVSKELRTLDVVIASEVVYHDFSFEQFDNDYPGRSQFECDEKLIKLAKKACGQCKEVKNFYVGRIASGDRFVQSSEIKNRIREDLGALCCDMEGACVGHVSFLGGVPFLVIRSISDFADEDANINYDEFEKAAALQVSRITMEILKAL